MSDLEQKMTQTFDTVRASAYLKRHTKAYIRGRTKDYGRFGSLRKTRMQRLACAMAVCVLLMTTLAVNYYPTSVITLDVNPSVTLDVNVFDRVIRLKGMNADGKVLADHLDVAHLPYGKALQRIFISDDMAPYLENESAIFITVVGRDSADNEKMLKTIICNAKVVADDDNFYYCQADAATAKEAAQLGLSPARYVALLKLRQTDPGLTAEDIQNMSMQEIREKTGFLEIENPCGD